MAQWKEKRRENIQQAMGEIDGQSWQMWLLLLLLFGRWQCKPAVPMTNWQTERKLQLQDWTEGIAGWLDSVSRRPSSQRKRTGPSSTDDRSIWLPIANWEQCWVHAGTAELSCGCRLTDGASMHAETLTRRRPICYPARMPHTDFKCVVCCRCFSSFSSSFLLPLSLPVKSAASDTDTDTHCHFSFHIAYLFSLSLLHLSLVFGHLLLYLSNAKMSIAWEWAPDFSAKCSQLSHSLTHFSDQHNQQQQQPFPQSLCLELLFLVDCCQRQCTGHSPTLTLLYCQPSIAGLISDQANQIWSRNVQCVQSACVWHRLCGTESDNHGRWWPCV